MVFGIQCEGFEEAYVKASNASEFDIFGADLVLDGEILAVGASGEDSEAVGVDGESSSDLAMGSGAVYVFARSGSTWRQEAYLKASNTNAGDGFGAALDLDGDTLVVGAPGESSAATGVNGDQASNESEFSGAVYVFRRRDGIWRQEAYLKASNTEPGDGFGSSLALNGETLAVGAPAEDSAASTIGGDQDDNLGIDSGAVYVFERMSESWTQRAYIKASNSGSGDRFGRSLDLVGATLVVGASNESSAATGVDGDPFNDQAFLSGAAYVFTRLDKGWSEQAYLKASNTGVRDQFGFSVSLDEDTLAVGAIGEGSDATGVGGDQFNAGARSSGAVYVFARVGTSWSQEAFIKASNTGEVDRFGFHLALLGQQLLIGAPGEDSAATGVDGDEEDDSTENSGAAYFFTRVEDSWEQKAYLKASNPGSSDLFGYSIDLTRDTLAVGALGEASAATGVDQDGSNDDAPRSGAVYVRRIRP